MFARTYKYTVADPAKYCDHEGCKTSHALVKCVWSGHKNPGPGYRFETVCTGNCGCSFGARKMRYVRDGNDPYWNPLPEQMGGNPDTWSEPDTNAAFSCCTNS